MTQDEIQAVARALAKAERLDWDEVCPLEHDDNAECNSSTCIAAHDEDHDPEWGRKIMLIKAQASIAALDAARGDQVARVVEWLREDANQTEVEATRIVKNTSGNARQNAAEWSMLVRLKRGLADAIERGEPFNG